eukprot:6152914-Amphidinium_carterae.1
MAPQIGKNGQKKDFWTDLPRKQLLIGRTHWLTDTSHAIRDHNSLSSTFLDRVQPLNLRSRRA